VAAWFQFRTRATSRAEKIIVGDNGIVLWLASSYSPGRIVCSQSER